MFSIFSTAFEVKRYPRTPHPGSHLFADPLIIPFRLKFQFSHPTFIGDNFQSMYV